MTDHNPVPLIGIEDVSRLTGLPVDRAREYLRERGESPMGVLHGRPLWDADTVHQILEDIAT
jgi:hypothetical protein